MEKWIGVEHAKTLTPNRQCWEAVKEWVAEDGLVVDYVLQIGDRTYNLSNMISNIKKSMESFTAQTKRGWHIQNIVQFLFNFLVSHEGQFLKQRRGINDRGYLTHWRQALCVTCQIPFTGDRRMFDPWTNRLNHNLNDIGQIVKEHNERTTIYYGNDGVMTFVAAYIAAMQIDDSKMKIRHQKDWHRMEFVHLFIYMLRDFLLKPIWSAKQLSTNPPIDIPADHRMRLLKMSDRIGTSFNERCREIAVRKGCSLNVARVNTSIMVICWKDWQDASLLLTGLANELLAKTPSIGAVALSIQKQVYLQILLYSTFLGADHGQMSEVKRTLLPLLHKYLFDRQPKMDVTQAQASGMMDKRDDTSHKKKS